ncbi:TetR/AcrR family transcriptional regulator [Nocardioides sp. AN3]
MRSVAKDHQAARVRRPKFTAQRRAEILDATVALLIERGYDLLRLEMIADRAKASKATIYRHWVSKQSLVVAAFLHSGAPVTPSDVDTGSLRGDLLEAYGQQQAVGRDCRLLIAVASAVRTDDELAWEFRKHFVAPRLRAGELIFERARRRGELAAGVEISLLLHALHGALLHHAVISGDVVDRNFVEQIVDHVLLPAAMRVVPPAP